MNNIVSVPLRGDGLQTLVRVDNKYIRTVVSVPLRGDGLQTLSLSTRYLSSSKEVFSGLIFIFANIATSFVKSTSKSTVFQPQEIIGADFLLAANMLPIYNVSGKYFPVLRIQLYLAALILIRVP